MDQLLLVTGFERFGRHAANPTERLALDLDGCRIGAFEVRGAVLPVDRREGPARALALLDELRPAVVLHLGLAEGRARIALERVAVNLLDYPIPDNADHRASGEPCVPGGPAAYLSTLPVEAIHAALVAAGIPAYLSGTAGAYLCNQTFYATAHAVAARGWPIRCGFVHVPLLPEMVAATGVDAPSMDLALMRRAVEITIEVLSDTR